MKIKTNFYITVLLFMIVSLFFIPQANAEDFKRMTKEELKAMIDNPDVVIVDVRSGRDWKSSESKIKNAVREEPYKADSWANKYDKSKTYVLYCA
jgi:rhodanese-related sulfurtransferase